MNEVVALLSQARLELEERRLELERLRSTLGRSAINGSRQIAVVGCSLRLPGGLETIEDLWDVLRAGRVAGAPIQRHRDYEESRFWRRACQFTARIACVEDPWGFDPRFFRMSPREARQVDPQQRLILELGWEALENAALAPSTARNGGIFVGLSSDDYQRISRSGANADDVDAYAGTGSHRSMAAGRLAAFLGWTGPALQIDTACSSSLVAVHLACQALRSGEIDVALAGGCHLILDPASIVERGALGALAPDGLCKPFTAEANGFGMGEGGAMVALRRYGDAVRAGDPIIAVIHGAAVNHNGAGAGITAPNPAAQERVMCAALSDAGAEANDVLFVEAHGTGTRLGDPIEAGAIQAVFGKRQESLPIGSAKANFGHVEAGAGILSLLKAMLVLRERTVPPTPATGLDSQLIPWRDWALRVPRALEPLPCRSARDRVGVSSFGMSGTNCHLVIGAAPPPSPGRCGRLEALPILLSAADEGALAALCSRLARFLRERSLPLPAVSRTLATGRAHLPHRAGFVARTTEEALGALEALARGEAATGVSLNRVVPGAVGRIAWTGGAAAVSDVEGLGRLRDACEALSPVAHGVLAAKLEPLVQLGWGPAQRLLLASFWAGVLGAAAAASLPPSLTARGADHEWALADLREAAAALDVVLDAADALLPSDAVQLVLDAPQEKGAEDLSTALGRMLSDKVVELFCRNVELNWSNIAQGGRIALPTYPFQRRAMQSSRGASGGRSCC